MKLRQVAIILAVFILGGLVGFWVRHSVPTMFDPEVIAANEAEKDIGEWTEFMIGDWEVSCPEPNVMCVEGITMSFEKNGTVILKDDRGVVIQDEVFSAIPWEIDSVDEEIARLKYMFVGPDSTPMVALNRVSEDEVEFVYTDRSEKLNLARYTQ